MKKLSILAMLLTAFLVACALGPMIWGTPTDGETSNSNEGTFVEIPTPTAKSQESSEQRQLTEPGQRSPEDKTLPLPAGRPIVQGRRYYSLSGNHYLIFQTDGNLVVYTSTRQFVWGLNLTTANFSGAQSAQMQLDGNLAVYGPDNAYIWSALHQNPDRRALLDLTADGVLHLRSDRSGIMWSSDGNLSAVENSDECIPFEGWAYCRMLTDPKIRIVASSRVSQSAIDIVAEIYTEMTVLFKPEYPKNKLDGYVVYITNGEPWSELNGLYPLGITLGKEEGDFLRGGASMDYLWISEQMICKTGVETRENDTIVRTYDQVIHEFGHTIDFNYGLRGRILQEYEGGWNPVEQFPWSIQHWFEAPIGPLTAAESSFIGEIFSGKRVFSCDQYTP
ncbi:MAG: hypothetical protein AAF629_26135 [Chloroflexota bacterium]